jgi:hypothetical protein
LARDSKTDRCPRANSIRRGKRRITAMHLPTIEAGDPIVILRSRESKP